MYSFSTMTFYTVNIFSSSFSPYVNNNTNYEPIMPGVKYVDKEYIINILNTIINNFLVG